MIRVLVFGGRDYAGRDDLYAALDKIHAEKGIDCIIQGGARGADRLAYEWAYARRVCCVHFPADWLTHGRAAGPLRNQRMLAEGRPIMVVACPGGRGTADMLARVRAAGLPIIEIKPCAA